MDSNERFDQLESLLVDLARKQDQQAEQIKQLIAEVRRIGTAVNEQGDAINQQGEVLNEQREAINQLGRAFNEQREAINQQSEAIARQEIKLDNIGDQIGDIINILKLSEARHTETEQRQDAMLVEIQRQGQRLDTSVDALKLLLKRQENADARLDGVVQAQLQTLQLMRVDADRLDGQEPRITRLEDEVFRAAS